MPREPSTGSDLRRRRAAVIFDLDGTLTRPHLNFDAIRAEIGLGPGPILESLTQLHGAALARAEAILHRHERDAAENAVLQEGAAEVVAACRAAGYQAAIVTRNSRVSLHQVLRAHGIIVDAARTREDGAIKPSPEPILSLCAEVDADPRQSWMIGDYLFDILSGRAAGACTVLMIGDAPAPEYAPQADHVIRRLPELLPLLHGDLRRP